MARFSQNRIVPIALMVIVLIIAIIALVSIGRIIFFPNSGNSSVTDTSAQALINTDADRQVQLTVRGPIVSDEDFTSYQIAITPNSRTLTTYSGYQNTVTSENSLPNSTQAYKEFVYALSRAGLAKGTAYKGTNDDTSGICASGELYTFNIMQGSQVIKDLWTTSCSGTGGSLDASRIDLVNLFKDQIPNANSLIQQTNL